MKILVVFGTRPEAIKMAPVVHALQADAQFECRVCVTAQHRQMLDSVLQIFGLRPDHDLNIMRKNQDLFGISSRILNGMRDVLRQESPDIVLVHGDTTTTFVASLSAFYERIPVGHVEAGLRTYNMHAPFPEEINRQLTTRLAHMHFAPTLRNRDNLLGERVFPDSIYVTGNTGIDALLWTRKRMLDPTISGARSGEVAELLASNGDLILITAHRRESFGAGVESICTALTSIAANLPEARIVYPVHPNPNIRGKVTSLLSRTANIHLINPVDYGDFVLLMDRAKIILTDSGGIQEEAPSLGKPVLVLRDVTERQEAVEAGVVALVGTETSRILDCTMRLMTNADEYSRMVSRDNPYGDGRAAERIADAIRARFGLRKDIPTMASTRHA